MAIWSPTVENVEGGNIAVTNFPATQAVTASDLDIRDLSSATDSVTVTGSVSVSNFPGASVAAATVTSVSVSPTVATLAASNPSRVKLIVHNEGGTLFVKLGSAATASSYSYRLIANSTLEITAYTGAVTAIKQTGTSNALVTEL